MRQSRRLNQKYIPGKFALAFLALIATAAATIAGSYFLLTRLAASGNDSAANGASFRLETVKVSLTVAGGLGALTALLVAYRKQRADEIGHVREQDRLFTDRFTAAAGQLGHEKAAVRLAGAYALTRIADDSQRDRDTCLNTLAAYLRMTPSDSSSASQYDPSEGNVRQSMLHCIIERLDISRPDIFWDQAYLNLSDTRLPDLNLSLSHVQAFAAFDGSVIEGNVKIVDVATGAPLQFKGCRFIGKVESIFHYEIASLVFTGSTFERGLTAFAGWRCEQFIDLQEATIRGSLLIEHQDSDGIDVFLQGADLTAVGRDDQGNPRIDIRASRVVYDKRTAWPRDFQPPRRWHKAEAHSFFTGSIPGWRRTTDHSS
ncbi:hypothetical protein [Micromonospora sp. DT62]|uniref:hypothetical protein n=1 Tax=Micromonospora sp. DT62 TaxID=3416521 RepID=UPI003CF5D071